MPLKHQTQQEYTYASQWKSASNLYIALFVFAAFVMVLCSVASANASGTDLYSAELTFSVINASFAGVWFFVLAITLFVAIRNPQSEYSIEKKSMIMIVVYAIFLLFAVYMFISQAYVCDMCYDYEGLVNWSIKGYSIVSSILLVTTIAMAIPGLVYSILIYKRSSGNYIG